MKERGQGQAVQSSVDERYTQWKSLVPVLYDWLANHNLVWPSLSCRWGPQLHQATYKNSQRLYLSEQTDGSVPNTLVIATCEVVKPRVAAAEHISQFNEEARSPFVKKFKTIIHPGEVNRIRELPQNSKIVATHTDSPDVLIWDVDSQPNRQASLGAADSRPDLVLTGHKDNAEFALAMSPSAPFVLSGVRRSFAVWVTILPLFCGMRELAMSHLLSFCNLFMYLLPPAIKLFYVPNELVLRFSFLRNDIAGTEQRHYCPRWRIIAHFGERKLPREEREGPFLRNKTRKTPNKEEAESELEMGGNDDAIHSLVNEQIQPIMDSMQNLKGSMEVMDHNILGEVEAIEEDMHKVYAKIELLLASHTTQGGLNGNTNRESHTTSYLFGAAKLTPKGGHA
ncbi:hypothetical protein KI387_020074 [Taxus chinensis]|uniref:Histone-binding protein RBBP4-like N-terminal domain-containing protein n=1 Tax=Taxus chinensis TaxID=29808 RepID=A0AA38LDY9_TAXCH|nr:hypothetical protein KI387_020074 [Taxus chinensis]